MLSSLREADPVTLAWRTLQSRAPVKLCAIISEHHYKAMTDFMNELIDRVGDFDMHPLQGLLDVVTTFVREYEKQRLHLQETRPADVLRLLMQQHDLEQRHFVGLFGAEAVVNDVLCGRREISTKEAKALGRRFGISPGVFS